MIKLKCMNEFMLAKPMVCLSVLFATTGTLVLVT